MMAEHFYDLCILGGGPAGYVASLRGAQLGLDVLLIDDAPYLGGTCLNAGCIPSKTLLHHSLEESLCGHHTSITTPGNASVSAPAPAPTPDLGNVPGNVNSQWEESLASYHRMQTSKERVVATLGHGVIGLVRGRGVTYVQGRGIVKSSTEVEMQDQSQVYRCRRLLLATGSHPTELAALPFDGERILSSNELLSLSTLPSSLAVVGGGVIGLELGSFFARMGTRVDVFELSDQLCPFLDLTLSQHLKKSLEAQGLTFHMQQGIDGGQVQESAVELQVRSVSNVTDPSSAHAKSTQVHTYERVLISVGRTPSHKGFDPDALGIEVDGRGHLKVNDRFETTAHGIWAIGDLIDGPMLAHKASEEALACVESMVGKSCKMHYIEVPSVIYTHPEIATVGLSEQQAIDFGFDCLKGICPIKANARARCSEQSEGLVKLIAERQSHRILGLHVMATGASEMIAFGTLCIRKEVTLDELVSLPIAHPTLSESIKEAALNALGRPLHL